MRFVEVRRETRTKEKAFHFYLLYVSKRVRRAPRAPFAKPFASRHPLIFSSSQNGPAMKFVHGKKT